MQYHVAATLSAHSSTQDGPTFPDSSSPTLSVSSNPSDKAVTLPPAPKTSVLTRAQNWLKLDEDYRARIHPLVSRFIGYRPPSSSAQHEPLPIFPFTLLNRISLKHEVWIFSFIGALGSILLIETIMSTHTAFQDVYHSPIIISSFGASAVLVFAVIDSPLAQPKNLVFGQLISGLIGVGITKLWLLNGTYGAALENKDFYAPSLVNGALCMSLSLLAQLVLGVVHPPGGATGLAAATEKNVVLLSWHYLPVLLASTSIMLGWALIINNLGRRRYPRYWWSADSNLVKNSREKLEQEKIKKLEEGVASKAEAARHKPEAVHLERAHIK